MHPPMRPPMPCARDQFLDHHTTSTPFTRDHTRSHEALLASDARLGKRRRRDLAATQSKPPPSGWKAAVCMDLVDGFVALRQQLYDALYGRTGGLIGNLA